MKVYLVGGAVRDKLLGMTLEDRDWVVVGATEQEMLDAGYKKLDASFPVFAHPRTGEEYALARTEVKIGPGYKGFQVYAGPDVTLEQDLKRRDLTINAMAEDEHGQIIDPFNGREDLEQGLLRHVSPAFDEDPVRLLRLARFAARLGRWGFRVAHGTFGILKKMAVSEELRTLKPERVWLEISRSLGDDQPWRFFDVLHGCGALDVLIPELDPGESSSHSGTVKPAPLAALVRICKTTADPTTRFAVLMQEAALDCADPTGLCRRLRAGKDYCEPMQLLRDHGSRLCKALDLNAEALLDLLEDLHALQLPDRFEQLVRAAKALCPDQTPIGVRLRTARNAAARIGGDELRAEGLVGEALGEALRQRRIAAISSDLPGRK